MKYFGLLAALLLAGCTSDAEWNARAAMARAESAVQVAEANTQAVQANARAAEVIANAQANVATTEIWAVALPGIALLLAILILVIVGLWLWDRHDKRLAEERRLNQIVLFQAMTQPTALPYRQQDCIMLEDGRVIRVREIAQRRLLTERH